MTKEMKEVGSLEEAINSLLYIHKLSPVDFVNTDEAVFFTDENSGTIFKLQLMEAK